MYVVFLVFPPHTPLVSGLKDGAVCNHSVQSDSRERILFFISFLFCRPLLFTVPPHLNG
uniref:Uncharacterized protein n=1 Tax=Anguilla anguilla TaxID=7936 RepID=A0A0E9S1V5_ANGAN